MAVVGRVIVAVVIVAVAIVAVAIVAVAIEEHSKPGRNIPFEQSNRSPTTEPVMILPLIIPRWSEIFRLNSPPNSNRWRALNCKIAEKFG